jgi:hypothetical protein
MACRFDKPRVTFEGGLGSLTLASAQGVLPALIFLYAMQLLPDQSWNFPQNLLPVCDYYRHNRRISGPSRVDRTD